MRLIDADALKADIEQFNRPLCDGYHMKDYVLNQIITDIENQPTIDAEPVRHGKWIDETFKPWGLVHHPFKCNLCGDHAEFASPYCPNCGARMDEE